MKMSFLIIRRQSDTTLRNETGSTVHGFYLPDRYILLTSSCTSCTWPLLHWAALKTIKDVTLKKIEDRRQTSGSHTEFESNTVITMTCMLGYKRIVRFYTILANYLAGAFMV